MTNHPNRANPSVPDGAPPIGDFVSVPFGMCGRQIAQVVGYARDGRIKVRAWNAKQGYWMPNARTLRYSAGIKPATAANLPPPPVA